jgi:hypothetical protein
MAISLQCTCGKMLKIDEKYRGKKAKCPACGAAIVVQEASETGVQAEAPKKPAVAAKDGAKPAAKADQAKPGAKRNLLPWLAAGGCGVIAIFSCFLCGGVGVWFFWLRSPAVGELRFVHADVQGFVSVRVADLMKSSAVKDQLNIAPPRDKELIDRKLAEIDKKFGLGINDIERVTLIFTSIDKKEVGVVIRTTKAMDQKKILAAMSNAQEEKKEGGAKYFVLERGGEGMAIHFDGNRAALLTETSGAMRDFLAGAGKPPTAPALARGVQLAAAGRHLVVFAFRLNARMLDDMLPPRDTPNLMSMNGFIATAKFEGKLAIEAIGIFSTSDDARRAKPDFESLQRIVLDDRRGNPPRRDQVEWMVHQFFQSAAIEHRGVDLVVRGKTDINLAPIVQVARNVNLAPPGQIQSVNNLKNLMLAMHSFHDANKRLPAGGEPLPGNPNGPPGLSWRVYLLPYIDEGPLYNQIRLNEPWDSAHNKQFWNKMPKLYQLPGKPNDGKTYYQVFRGNETVFPDRIRVTMVGITDGTSNTLAIVEAAQSVNWMAPDDIPFQMNQPKQMLDRIGNHWGDDTFVAALCDGIVRRLRRSMPPMTLQALITRSGGEVLNPDDID